MNLSLAEQIFQLVVWFVALMEFVVGVYVLLLNVRHRNNQALGGLLLLFSLNNWAVGTMLGATTPMEAQLPSFILAITIPAIQPALLLLAIVLLKPAWLQRGRWRFVWWGVALLVVAPLILTLIDLGFSLGWWYTGLDDSYAGGYVTWRNFVQGSLVFTFMRMFVLMGIVLVTIALLGYLLWRDKTLSPLDRRLARVLLVAMFIALIIQGGIRTLVPPEVTTTLTGLLLVIAYAYAAFQQLLSERQLHRGSLQVRLTGLILGITMPIIVVVVMLVGSRARTLIALSQTERLRSLNEALAANVFSWRAQNLLALEELVTHPDVVSMDPERQRPLLKGMALTLSQLRLVSTIGTNGMNVARSDGEVLQSYRNRTWFREIVDSGVPMASEVSGASQSDNLMLVVAMPIREPGEPIQGVGMAEIDLSELSAEVRAIRVGEEGYAYLVNEEGLVLAHPNSAFLAEVSDFSALAPVRALHAGTTGLVRYQDAEGTSWWSYVERLDNGWGVVVQQPQEDLWSGMRELQLVSWGVAIVGVTMLLTFAWFTIRQALSPIYTLTETATAVAAGDLNRTVPVESEDEIGTLARAFNAMTEQVRELVHNLEQRVAQRTEELERRAEYLAATSEVGRVAASILDADTLLERVVYLITQRFGFYHAGIFLVDERAEWASLRATSSEGGRRMLARHHRLKVGEQGIVGYVSNTGKPRIALDVGEDAVWFNSPDLPDTRSEMGLPMVVHNRVIGVLDVQSQEAEAFSSEDVATLQILADQIAIAIENARLFQENQQALRSLQATYEEASRIGWAEREENVVGYSYHPGGTTPIVRDAKDDVIPASSLQVDEESNTLMIPLHFGEVMIGVLRLQRDVEHPWTGREIEFVAKMVQDLAQAMENARLLTETRERAARNRVVREVSERLRSSLDPEMILRETVQSLGRVLGAELVAVEVTGPDKLSVSNGDSES